MIPEIKLPPLVGNLSNMSPHLTASVLAYGQACARQAIELYRRGRGGPVGYVHPNVAAYGVKEGAMIYSASRFVEGAGVPVYLHPQPADPVVKESLTVAEPVKAECRSPYCECEKGKCTHGLADKRGEPSAPPGRQSLTFEQWWAAGGHRIVSAEAGRRGWEGAAEAGYIGGLLSSAAPTPAADGQAQQDVDMIECACGDMYPATSYGAGFIDAAGMCENCHASDAIGKQDADKVAGTLTDEGTKSARDLFERMACIADDEKCIEILADALASAQPDPAMAGDAVSDDDIESAVRRVTGDHLGGYTKNDRDFYGELTRELFKLKRVQPDSREGATDAARYRAWRDAMIAENGVFLSTVQNHIGDEEDLTIEICNAAIDAAMQQGGQN